MIFVLGGLVILTISFIVALVSLFREQKDQQIPDDSGQNGSVVKPNVYQEKSIEEPELQSGVVEKGEEQEKTEKRDEAYRILQSRVQKLTESEALGEIDHEESKNEIISEPNKIADISDGDTAEQMNPVVAEKVPFPWEDKVGEQAGTVGAVGDIRYEDSASWLQNPTNESKTGNDNLSGQISLEDLKKTED